MYGNAQGVGCFWNKRSPKVELRSAYVENTLRGSPKVDLRSSMSRTPSWVQGHITLHIVALVAKISFFIFACDIYPVDIRGERMKKSG